MVEVAAMTVDLDKLRSVAAEAPRDAVIVHRGQHASPANRMLLALSSDFLEAAFRHCDDGRVDLSEVEQDDVDTVIAYSEGRYEPAVEDVSRLMRVQDRFLMPALRRQCEAMLRAHVSADSWRDVAKMAASYRLWNLVTYAAVWASRQSWTSSESAFSVGDVLPPETPAECVSAVLAGADFLCMSHKFSVAARWRAASQDPDADRVFEALGSEADRLWPSEVRVVLEHEACMPRRLVSDIARAIASNHAEKQRQLPHHNGVLVSQQQRIMAKVDASIEACQGPGMYQMIIAPSATFGDAYFSKEVPLNANAEYHVYLDPDEKDTLHPWWCRHNSTAAGGLHVAVRFRRPPRAAGPPA
jgi:hypothetical protein